MGFFEPHVLKFIAPDYNFQNVLKLKFKHFRKNKHDISIIR